MGGGEEALQFTARKQKANCLENFGRVHSSARRLRNVPVGSGRRVYTSRFLFVSLFYLFF